MDVFLGESIEGKKTKKGICGIDRMMTWFEIAQPSILSHLTSARIIQNTRDHLVKFQSKVI